MGVATNNGIAAVFEWEHARAYRYERYGVHHTYWDDPRMCVLPCRATPHASCMSFNRAYKPLTPAGYAAHPHSLDTVV